MKILPFTTWEKIEKLHVVMMACQADGNIMGLLELTATRRLLYFLDGWAVQ